MAQVVGLGGLFFKADDPKKLYQWYETHLGIKSKPGQGMMFTDGGPVVWTIFPRSSKYFDPSKSGFMMNFRVDDLDAVLARLKEAGAEIDPKREDYDYGRFGWVMDPEGNRIELWQPKPR
jgi:predicted enzyme related to lactoylglutathione lyase